jgi:hypothetical protein
MSTQIVVGQEVAVQDRHSVRFDYKVTKVTPSGQVVIQRNFDGYEMRFDKNGYQMNTMSSHYYKDRLVLDVVGAKEESARKDRARLAERAILAVGERECRYTYGKETMLKQIAEMEVRLAAAKAAVEAI